MKQHIYADNAATTKLDIDAFEAMKPYLLEEYGNASQPYFFGKKAAHAIKEARKTIAECINASPEEIFFTSGGTESDNWVIKCFGFSSIGIRHIVTSKIEHHAVLNACHQCEIDTDNTDVFYISNDQAGTVSTDDLKNILQRPRKATASCETTLVSVMFANNEIGTIQPIKELAGIAHDNDALFHTDAVQAVGHVKIDVKDLDVDYLSASAHKFNGPKGIGFLYVRKGAPIYPLHNGGEQENGMRAGTEDVAAIVGMASALKRNTDHMEKNTELIMSLESLLVNELNVGDLDYIRNGSTNHIPGNISLSFRDCDGETLLHRMDLKGICISTGSACDSVNTQISHVLKAINLKENYAKGTIRISLGKNNTLDEVRIIADSIIRILRQ